MAAEIRLKRVGKKKQGTFRIVVTESSDSVRGPAIENLGVYNPRTEPSLVRLDAERALHWLRSGAMPSDTVKSIFRKVGLWEQYHEGVTPEELEEREVTLGPAPGEQKTSRRAQQVQEAAEAKEAAADEEPEAEAEGEPAAEVDEEPEAEAEEEPEAEEEQPAAEGEEEPEASAEDEDGDEAEQDEPEPDEEPEAEADEEPEDEEADEPEASAEDEDQDEEADEPEASAEEIEEEEGDEEKEG